MSIVKDEVDGATGRYVKDSAKILIADPKKDKLSQYVPQGDDALVRLSILKDFQNGWQTMHMPRPEFNDLSLYQRHITDMLAFNTYQENDGNPAMEDRLGGWRSTAMRPIQRNKAISIAAHETARLTVPKIFAYDEDSDEQEDSAKVMSYLVDWAREQANYTHEALFRVIASLYSPISWGFTEYAEQYRLVYEDGELKQVIDEDYSGHRHTALGTDQVFFPNFYERDPQKQDFLIIRRIISYDTARNRYATQYGNFQYVQPGIQVVMDDANNGFYQVYDSHMRDQDVEEVIRWRKNGARYEVDSKHIMVNGVLLTPAISPNPRLDHQYPLDAFYYLPINEKCIAGKSLVFAMGPESILLNTQYQMINDGNFLNLFPPTITTGSDKIGMDLIVPGLNTAFSESDVEVNPLRTASDASLNTAMKVMEQVEASLNASSQDPVQQGQNPGSPSTAYEISRIEQNAATVLGLSMKFIAQHAINYGKLLVSDILQYQTVADAQKITSDNGLVYKTFYAPEPGETGKMNKVKFDLNLPDSMSEQEQEDMSFAILKEQGGIKSDMRLWKVNPVKFRNFKYQFTVDADVLNPRSADLTRALDIETFDRAIASPVADQTALFKDLLMATNPKTARDPDKYIMKPQPQAQPTAMADPNGMQPGGGAPASQPQQGQPTAIQQGKVPA